MGITVHGAQKKRDVDKEKHLKRLHKTVPWIESPLQGADHENRVFSQRHEASTVELFFDLFFVANLATFTAYHAVVDHSTLFAYIGFFAILWCTWYQVTLHDVRFARDSIYERACKIVQYICLVGLALVGSSFIPGGSRGTNANFRILCYVMVTSRILLMIQYLVVLVFTILARYRKLYLPLAINAAIYGVSAGAFGAMTPAFEERDDPHEKVYLVWYIVSSLEVFGVVAIACIWRMLSFKKTHLVERMGLLTLIVIGEGAIGVTKTISKMMGKYGLDPEGCFLIMCIILVLVFLWALYFDHSPTGHYGTIRQQIWSTLHFPFHLAVVGLVEGSQQLALARYIIKNYEKLWKSFVTYCIIDHYDGEELVHKLNDSIQYFQLDKKLESKEYAKTVYDSVEAIGNVTGICSAENVEKYADRTALPRQISELFYNTLGALYSSLGMELPDDKDPAVIAYQSWKVVQIYYWAAFGLVMACLIIFLVLVRRHRHDIFDWVSVITRAVFLAVGGGLIALAFSPTKLVSFLYHAIPLPLCVAFLSTIMITDRMAMAFVNWRLKKSGEPYAVEADEHGHGGHDDHPGSQDGHDHSHSSGFEERKNAHGVHHDEERDPLTANTAYISGAESYAMGPMNSPSPHPHPQHSPHHAAGGYMPVSTAQHYSA